MNISFFKFTAHQAAISVGTTLILEEFLTPDNPTIPIHLCPMFVTDEQGKQFKFIVAHSYDRRLPSNHSLSSVRRGTVWCGELLIVKMGSGGRYMSLLRLDEVKLAREALVKCHITFGPAESHPSHRFLKIASEVVEDGPVSGQFSFPPEILYGKRPED